MWLQSFCALNQLEANKSFVIIAVRGESLWLMRLWVVYLFFHPMTIIIQHTILYIYIWCSMCILTLLSFFFFEYFLYSNFDSREVFSIFFLILKSHFFCVRNHNTKRTWKHILWFYNLRVYIACKYLFISFPIYFSNEFRHKWFLKLSLWIT